MRAVSRSRSALSLARRSCYAKEIEMDILTLIWINTIVLLFAVITQTILVVFGLRKISETLGRLEQLSLATLSRLAPQQPQA
jgi:hypothetical protein